MSPELRNLELLLLKGLCAKAGNCQDGAPGTKLQRNADEMLLRRMEVLRIVRTRVQMSVVDALRSPCGENGAQQAPMQRDWGFHQMAQLLLPHRVPAREQERLLLVQLVEGSQVKGQQLLEQLHAVGEQLLHRRGLQKELQ
jgi:hypothetical protein